MRKISKLVSVFLLFCIIMSNSINTNAATTNQSPINQTSVLIYQGYTDDGVKYEVYKTVTSGISPNAVVTKKVTRTVRFNTTNITPPKTVYWEEKLDSYTTFSGTLTFAGSYLKDYVYNFTDADYKGTLVGRI